MGEANNLEVSHEINQGEGKIENGRGSPGLQGQYPDSTKKVRKEE